jgi:hypothetical protein
MINDEEYMGFDKSMGAETLFRKVRSDGGSDVDAIRITRKVFGISLLDAKDIMLKLDGWQAGVESYQKEVVLPIVEELFRKKS